MLRIDATGDSIGVAAADAEHADARVDIGWRGNPADESARIEITAGGSVRGIAMPEGAPRELGRDLELVDGGCGYAGRKRGRGDRLHRPWCRD